MSESKNLEIKITTPADLSGAKAIEQAIERDIEKAKALNKDFGDLQERLNQVRRNIGEAEKAFKAEAEAKAKSADEAKRLADTEAIAAQQRKGDVESLENSAAATDKLKFKKEDLKKVVTSLGQQFPLLGNAINMALNPVVGSLIAVITTIGYFRKAWAEAEQAVKDAEWGPVTTALNAQREVLYKGGIEADNYGRKLRDITTAQTTLQTSTDNTIKRLQALNVAQAELDDKRKALAIAEVNDKEKSGKLTPVQAIKSRIAIEEDFAAKKIQREDAQAQKEIQLREEELRRNKASVPELSRNADRAFQERLSTEGNKAILDKVAEEDAAVRLPKEREQLAKDTKQIEGWGDYRGIQDAEKEAYARDKEKFESQSALVAQLEKLVALNEERSKKQERDLAEKKAKEEKAFNQLEEALKRIEQLESELPQLKEDAQISSEARRAGLDLDKRKNVYEVKGAEREAAQDAEKEKQKEEAERLKHKGVSQHGSNRDGLSTKMEDPSGKLEKVLTDTERALASVGKIAESHGQAINEINQYLARLSTEQEVLRSQMLSGRRMT